MTRSAILAALLLASTASYVQADCHKLVVAVPNDPTLTDRLIGLVGPATHVVAFIGIVKGNVRLAALAEGAAFAKETYDYINKLSPQDRATLEVCDQPAHLLGTALGANKPVLIGTKKDLDTLFTTPPARLAPIHNDFSQLGAQMALQPLGQNTIKLPTLGERLSRPLNPAVFFGHVSGVVRNADGLPMAGVIVWLLQEDGSSSLHVTSNSTGEYTFLAMPGKYVLASYNTGYRGWSLHIETQAGGDITREIRFVR